MAAEYGLIKFLSMVFDDKDLIGYYSSAINTFVAAIVPVFVLFAQIMYYHKQFSFGQRKNELSTIINLSIKYLNIYNLDILKQLLFDWQYNRESHDSISKELKRIKEEADTIWLQFSFEINPDDIVSIEFLSNQKKNYKILCSIYEDLRILFNYSYSELRDVKSTAYKRISDMGGRLSYCLNEKLLVKAVFEDYSISYSQVKDEIEEYLNILKKNLNNTLKIYEKTNNEKQ